MHASEARAATVARFQARPGADDQRVIAQVAERRRAHDERLARQADRQRVKEEQLARELEAQLLQDQQEREAEVARLAQAESEAQAAQAARRERLAAKTSNMADQKALRDSRYAARKARQKR